MSSANAKNDNGGKGLNNPFMETNDLIDLTNDDEAKRNPFYGSDTNEEFKYVQPPRKNTSENPFSDTYAAPEEEIDLEGDTADSRTGIRGGRSSELESREQANTAPGLLEGFRSKISNSYRGMGTDEDQLHSERNIYQASESKFDIRDIFKRLKSSVVGGGAYKKGGHTEAGHRRIFIMNNEANKRYGYFNNSIYTTKYNFATFIPKFLFEQFSKYANLFFLLTSVVQQVPNASPTNRYTTVGTLIVVLVVSATKEIIEDIKRARADRVLNNKKVQVLNEKTGEYMWKPWIKVRVGDVVKVLKEESFPADLLLLSSSEPEGLCYIETANLDGETNLKIKQAKAATSYMVNPRYLVSDLRGSEILSEQPNSSLYTYEGNLKNFGTSPLIPFAPEQMLLRGATLRNTQWIQGVAIFTGHETKLMRNATSTPIKRTDIERTVNVQIIVLFVVLIVLSFISALANVIKLGVDAKELKYIRNENVNKAGTFFLNLLTFWILLSNLVPISLFVTLEVIKYYQAFMIGSDLDMYYEETDTPSGVRTSSLVEELGQIEYVFSDKTGTLTRNVMEFKSCSIGGKCFTQEIPEEGRAQIVDGIETGYNDFETMFDLLRNGDLPYSSVINEFFTLLGSCHTVIPEVNDEDGSIKYQAASPDEGALVEGASRLGYKFLIRKPRGVVIQNAFTGKVSEYELLNICEFNSTRKRMSAIFRCPDGVIRLFCKGADTVILERLSNEGQTFVDATLRHLEDFAAEGLRTLCIASRVVPETEYEEWSKIYYEASTSISGRVEKLGDAAELIEKNLFLLGATAIEDKLQDGVPDTIQTLQDANIKVWVLTGDRQETAINIGMSCKLLSEDMNLLIVNEETKQDTKANLQEKLEAIYEHQYELENSSLESSLALVIDGHSLGYALDPDLEDLFINVGSLCKAVVCCRVSPLQKALVVKMVKRKKKGSLLLAIGDGANDVSMIQAAHVGVGISGMEGMQASRNADISIGQFKYLRKLLLVHGSWCYQRISTAIVYSFYKNVTLYMMQFWYIFADAYSGQSLIESWTLTFYNVFFTVLPPFVMGVFDQFVSARLLDRYPQLYQAGQQKVFFNVTIFWGWVANGFFHSAVIFLCSFFVYGHGDRLSNGKSMDIWAWGSAVYTTCVLTVLGKAALVVTLWTKFTVLAIPGSFLAWLAFFPIYCLIAPNIDVSQELRGILSATYGSLTFWSMVFGITVLCLLRDLAWKFYRRNYMPQSYHYVQEIQKYNIQDFRPRMEQFQKAIRKVRQVQRIKKQRGFAFSQVDNQDQEKIVRLYDTTKKRGVFGELSESS